jgi:two-component system chemotaxis response regulator CheB
VEALQVLLRGFPEDCPPTMIVQHVDSRFAPAIARTLNAACPAQVLLAEPDMPLRRGHVSGAGR